MNVPDMSRVWVALLILVGLVGCSRDSVPAQRPANTDTGGNVVSGTGPRYGSWDGKLAVVVWFDTDDSSQGFAGEGGTAVYQEGYFPRLSMGDASIGVARPLTERRGPS